MGRSFDSCTQWREGVMQRIDEEQPDLVLLGSYHNPERLLDADEDDPGAGWRDGLTSTLEQIDGPQVAVLQDVPTQQRKPDHCLAKNLERTDRCDVPRELAFQDELLRAEEDAIAETDTGAAHLDLSRYFCNAESCPMIIGNTMVFRDNHHLTETFSRQMDQPMWEEIEPLLA